MQTQVKQQWVPGATVKVGFLSLKVIAKVATPGDYKPDAYVLASKTGFYEFVPHNGLNKITEAEARDLIAAEQARAARVAAAAITKAQAAAKHAGAVADLLAA